MTMAPPGVPEAAVLSKIGERRRENGDLWNGGPARWRVVPTNLVVGMGGGIARQAAVRFPELPRLYGGHLRGDLRRRLFWWPLGGIVCLPTRVRWRQDSDRELLEGGLREFGAACVLLTLGDIRLPRIGAGLGGCPGLSSRRAWRAHSVPPQPDPGAAGGRAIADLTPC